MRFPPFDLERYFARHEFSARHLLCVSDCETLSLGELLGLEPGALQELLGLRLGYTESAGHSALRAGIAAGYAGINASETLVFSGAEEAILAFSLAVLAPDAHVVVQTPCYQSLRTAPEAAGCRVTAWPGRPENGWLPELEALPALIRPDTRAVIVNFPHNPTGALPDRDWFQALLDIVRGHDLLLFSDEVYRGLEYAPEDRLPAACELYEKAVSLGVMSKAYGLAGLRIGWVATRDRDLLRAMAGFKDYTTICNSAPSEFLATLALRHAGQLLERNRAIVTGNLTLAEAFFARQSERLAWTLPKAGPVAFPQLRAGSATAFCAEVLRTQGVLLAPGPLFGGEDASFRLGLGRSDFADGLARLEACLADTDV